MNTLTLEYSLWAIPLCLLIGSIYGYALYSYQSVWSKRVNLILFGIRTLIISLIIFLLLGPAITSITHRSSPPVVVFLVDNSISVKTTKNKETWMNAMRKASDDLQQQGYTVHIRTLSNQSGEDTLVWDEKISDLTAALRRVSSTYEKQNLHHVVLISDGIYNTGLSPLYFTDHFPVSTVGVGDSIPTADIFLKSLQHNKIAYQGNSFPLRAEVITQGINNTTITVVVSLNGKEWARQSKKVTKDNSFNTFDFILKPNTFGLHQLDVRVLGFENEKNTNNNFSSSFIDIIKGKKKVVLVAPAPHPDMGSLRRVIEAKNYSYTLIISGITDPKITKQALQTADLIIIHDAFGKSSSHIPTENILNHKASLFFILCDQPDLPRLQSTLPLTFKSHTASRDEVFPMLNRNFLPFYLHEKAEEIIHSFPPTYAPYGNFSYPSQAQVLLYQRIGNISTNRPLLLTWENGDRKIALSLSSNFWTWRLQNYTHTQNTDTFDELFGKLFQYLSLHEKKNKFNCFPTQNAYTMEDLVQFKIQSYNDVYEPIHGNSVEISLKTNNTAPIRYQLNTYPSSPYFDIGHLEHGLYSYIAKTQIAGKTEIEKGKFVVQEQSIEYLNLTADFKLLRRLAHQNEGQFFTADQWPALTHHLSPAPSPLLFKTEQIHPIINWTWLFYLIVLLISTEWFARRYFNSY